MKLKECRKCVHYEREKTHEEDGGQTKVMCKYCIDTAIAPFGISWVEIFTTDNEQLVKCPMELKKTC